MSGAALAEAALALAGTRFRLHGRDPATGLDCVGLLGAALAAIGRAAPLPSGYRLRATAAPWADAAARACGLGACGGATEPGDVLLVRPAPTQFHLLIAGPDGAFVHAHAGRGRVVVMPAPLAWPVVRHWRLTEKD